MHFLVIPAPAGFAAAPIKPRAAYWHAALGEFVLPYEALRQARDVDATLLDFLLLENAIERPADGARSQPERLPVAAHGVLALLDDGRSVPGAVAPHPRR